jgi:hypothetical protein
VQGVLLAIMNVLVFSLPLYQIWLDLREPFSAALVKAAESYRNVRRRLRSRSGAADPAAQDPPEVAGSEQARCEGDVPRARVPRFALHCRFKWSRR